MGVSLSNGGNIFFVTGAKTKHLELKSVVALIRKTFYKLKEHIGKL